MFGKTRKKKKALQASRKEFFQKGLQDLGRSLFESPVGDIIDRQLEGFSNMLDPHGLAEFKKATEVDQTDAENHTNYTSDKPLFVRPPGALQPGRFEQACNRCGDCIVACPHGTLFRLDFHSGPFLNPNYIACLMCEDYPCIRSCETGALLFERLPVEFGQAFLKGTCLNETLEQSPESRQASTLENPPEIINPDSSETCDKCKAICPIDAITLLDLPEISESCTGCGLCIATCPVDALQVKPLH